MVACVSLRSALWLGSFIPRKGKLLHFPANPDVASRTSFSGLGVTTRRADCRSATSTWLPALFGSNEQHRQAQRGTRRRICVGEDEDVRSFAGVR
jgi:hypothetical protein